MRATNSRMKTASLFLVLLGLLPLPALEQPTLPLSLPAHTATLSAQEIPHPDDFLGFELGADYTLADVDELYTYYRALADASPRVVMEEIGRTTRDRPMYLLYISTEENVGQLDRWKDISARLARARDLTDEQARELAREGKAVVWIDSGLHSTELAHSQHAPLLAYHMATDESEESARIREDVILLLMPLMNPDGHQIVTDWYRAHSEEPWELALPEVYHEYVGHDNNRDWFMIRQEESKVVTRQLWHEWYPQIVFNHHQTAPFPARIFIPPFADPVNPHIPPLVVRGVNMVGEHMSKRLEELEMPGVVSRMTFTMWWNGGMRTAPYFHNQVGLLSEVGHNSPTPQYHEPDDLPEEFGPGAHRISAQEPSVYYMNPWEGGWARFGDAVQYHFETSLGALDIGQRLKEDWLFNIYRMGRNQIRDGEAGGPFAYVVDLEAQWDRGEAVEMLNVLRRGGVEVHRATSPFTADGQEYPAGTYVAFAGQAFRAHLMDLLEAQEHPHREQYPGGPPQPPYGGLAGWTLPFQMAVDVDRVEDPFQASVEEVDVVPVPEPVVASEASFGFVLSERRNASRLAVNRLLGAGETVHRAEDGFQADGASFGPGAFVVEGSDGTTRNRVEEVARDLGLRATALEAQPQVELTRLRSPRVGLYMPWTGNMDEGWTRFLFNTYEVQLDTVRNAHFQEDLSQWDALVLSDQGAQSIYQGRSEGSAPPEYVGGIGSEGVENLRAWVEGGGTLVTFDGASDFAIQHLELPVANAVADVPSEELFIPGSLLRMNVDPTHPVAYGMRDEAAAFFQGSRAFDVEEGHPALDVVAHYADSDLLMSGWELGAEEYLAGQPAVVRVEVGEGEVVLIGFRPQFRAQPAGTFKLIFNPLHGSGREATLLPR